ncbi:MAG: M1 family aminopeptidase [Bacteroidia bacterium]|nr:M1 family aminopeptidase [Bacteroidia bacterium]
MRILFSFVAFAMASFSFAQHQHPCSQSKIQHKLVLQKALLRQQQNQMSSTLMNNYDVKFHHLNLNLERTNKNISGYVRTLAKVTSTQLDTFAFVLHQNYTIDSVYINGLKHTTIITTDSLRRVKLINPVTQNNLLDAYIYYHGTAHSMTTALGNGFDNGTSPSWGNQVTWSLSETRGAYHWWPCKQDLRDKIDSAWIFVTTDSSNMVGSNGILSNVITLGNKKRYEWKTQYPIDYYLISVAVAKYKPYKLYAKPQYLLNDSILILNYIYDNAINNPFFISNQKVDLDKIKPTLEFLSKMYGMYPFYKEKYGHSMAPIGGGMEHQTMTTIGFFDFMIDAHELGHQWWGDMVTCKTWGDIWINEGFASYTEHLANQYLDPTNFMSNLNSVHNNVMSQPGGSIFFTGTDTTDDNRIFDSRLTYDKGGAIIHTLRFVTNNDSVFFNGLRNFLNTYKWSTATAMDFKTNFETYTGQNLTQFFNQWYFGEGYPTFNVKWNYFGNTLIIQSTQTTSKPTSVPLFITPIEYKLIRSSGGDTIIRVMHSNSTETYTFTINGNVTNIQVDPNNWLINKTIGPLKDGTLYVNSVSYKVPINIFPNPVTDILHIESSFLENKNYEFIDLTGKIILKGQFKTNSEILDLSQYSKGIYFLILKDNQGNIIANEKMMINNSR